MPETDPERPVEDGPASRVGGGLLLLLGLAFALAALPLLAPYQVAGHSALSDVVRGEAFHASVRGGDWTPRWLPDFYFRHGSPTFHFYAPLGFYGVEVFRLLGAGALWSLKLATLTFWLLGTWGTWGLGRRLWGPAGAVVAAAAYAFSPYLLVDLYVRVGLAEVAGFGLLPLAIWGVWEAARGMTRRRVALAALAVAGLVLAHNITGLISLPLLAGLGLVGARDWMARRRIAFALAMGLCLSAFFWLPALLDKKAVQAESSLTGGYLSYEAHFVPLGDLLSRSGDFGFVVGPRQKLLFELGDLLWLGLVAAALGLAIPALRRRLPRPAFAALAGVAAAVCLGMTHRLSAPLWEHLPLLPFVQFPWRFLLPLSCFAALLAGAVPSFVPRRLQGWIAALLVLLAFFGSAGFRGARYAFLEAAHGEMVMLDGPTARQAAADARLVSPQERLDIEGIRRAGVTGTVGHEYLPAGVSELPRGLPAVAASLVSGEGTVRSGGWSYPGVWAEIEARGEAVIELHQFAFPGWRVRVDGEPAEVLAASENGRLRVALPPGVHRVEARFGASPQVWAGRVFSLLGLFVLLVWTPLPWPRRTR